MIIRYSMIQDYLTCPKSFYDRHVLKKIETEQSAALHFGTALHLGLRTCLEGEDGVSYFNMYWDSIKDLRMTYYGDSWQGLKESGEHFLGNFKSRHAKKFSDFKQEIQMEMPFLFDSLNDTGQHTLQGTADLIGMYEGKLTVCDWKTSSKAYRKNKIVVNPQMYIYAKLYEHTHGKLPEQIMYKVFNKKEGSINTLIHPLTPESIQCIFKYIENASTSMIRCIETKELYHGAECYCSIA